MKKTIIFIIVLTVSILFTQEHLKKLIFSGETSSILHLSLDDKIESLDPAKSYSDDSLLVSSQVLEPLYQYHYLKRPYEIVPLVADGAPQISDSGKVIFIKIKKGIFFHPHPAFENSPRELTSHDFVVQFKRLALMSLNSPARGIFSGVVKGFADYSDSISNDWKKIFQHDLRGVQAVDSHTLKIELIRNEPNLKYYLALNFITPVPWELVQYYQNKLDDVLIGTGPYILKQINNSIIEMEKFSNYRDDFYPSSGDRYANVENLLTSSKEKIPFIQKVKFHVTTGDQDKWKKFFNQELDILTVPKTFLSKVYDKSGKRISAIEEGNITLKHFPSLSTRWISFNMRNPLWRNNKFLRKAIAHAIDFDEYIEVLSKKTNLQANSILVPGIPGYMPSMMFPFKFDLDLSRKYLKLAGVDSADKKPLIIYSTRGSQKINILEAEFIKKQLNAINLDVKIEILTFQEFLKKGRAGELMFFTDNWIFDYPDGENIIQLLVSSNTPGINKSGFSNQRLDELYMKLKKPITPDERDLIIHQAEKIVFEEVPWIPLMYESSFVLYYPKIKNYRKSSLIRNYIKYLKIEK